MAETITPAATPAKKGKAAGKAKKPKTVSTHPKVSDMVNTAITSLKERGGSSLSAIKKYIGSHYKVDLEKLSPFIRKYVRSAVASGSLVQVKGKGANGSFRMKSAAGPKEKTAAKPKSAAKKASAPKKPKAAATPKKAAKAKPKKAAVKKTPKKPAVKKAKPAAKKVKPAKSPKAKAAKKASPKKGKK